MEQTILESFKIAPALVALVVVVYLFIKAQQWMIKNNEETGRERVAAFMETIKSMHSDHLEARDESRTMIAKNAISNEQLSQALTRVEVALNECAQAKRQAGMR